MILIVYIKQILDINISLKKLKMTKKFKNVFWILVSLLFLGISTSSLFAQSNRVKFVTPKIDGYHLLTADFHVHTVFSDGSVWPTTRVDEAVAEGIDVISITDHIEYRPKLMEFISKDHNRAYDLAADYAAQRGVILIRGTEVTRRMAPGHFNAIFIKDANAFEKYVNKSDSRDGSNIVEALQEGINQGGFVFWNHPWYQNPNNVAEWFPIHQELYERGLIAGIEVVNGNRYDPVILDWCLDKNLTVIANTDLHAPSYLNRDQHRTMTIVFAKERSAQAVQNALENRATIAYSQGSIYGHSEYISLFVDNSLSFELTNRGERSNILKISNSSTVPYTIRVDNTNSHRIFAGFTFTVESLSQIEIELSSLSKNQLVFEYSVLNAWVRGDENFASSF